MASAQEDRPGRAHRVGGDVRAEVRAASCRPHQPGQHVLRQLAAADLVPQRLAQVNARSLLQHELEADVPGLLVEVDRQVDLVRKLNGRVQLLLSEGFPVEKNAEFPLSS